MTSIKSSQWTITQLPTSWTKAQEPKEICPSPVFYYKCYTQRLERRGVERLPAKHQICDTCERPPKFLTSSLPTMFHVLDSWPQNYAMVTRISTNLVILVSLYRRQVFSFGRGTQSKEVLSHGALLEDTIYSQRADRQ